MERFEAGETEFFELVELPESGDHVLRYMAPLFVKKSCLKCHASQGYEEGDLRGGISIELINETYRQGQSALRDRLGMMHLVCWSGAMLLVGFLGVRLVRDFQKLREAERQVEPLESLLPICMHYKRVRSTGGPCHEEEFWLTIEDYVAKETKTMSSHGICPRCGKERFPNNAEEILENARREYEDEAE